MDKEKERIKWACRRGMLEVDLFLVPFFEKCFDDLNESERLVFEQMLQEPDPQLLAWFMDEEVAEDPKLSVLIKKIRSFKLSKV